MAINDVNVQCANIISSMTLCHANLCVVGHSLLLLHNTVGCILWAGETQAGCLASFYCISYLYTYITLLYTLSVPQVSILRKAMEFVEQYLSMHDVWSFEDKEQNLLTYEVCG